MSPLQKALAAALVVPWTLCTAGWGLTVGVALPVAGAVRRLRRPAPVTVVVVGVGPWAGWDEASA